MSSKQIMPTLLPQSSGSQMRGGSMKPLASHPHLRGTGTSEVMLAKATAFWRN